MICKRVWSASVAAMIVIALTAPLHSQPPDTHRGRDSECANPPGWTLTQAQIEAIKKGQDSRYLCNADLRPALPTIYRSVEDIDLSGADLAGANLRDSFLADANFDKGSLGAIDLSHAQLSRAKFDGASLKEANLSHADLSAVDLNDADLSDADLSNAQLMRARLTNTAMIGTNLSGAHLALADLTGATYAPIGQPADDVEGIEGIKTVRFWPGQETGLVQLRSLFQKGGLRDLEREATYAIEFNTTRHLFSEMTPPAIVEGAFRLVFFEWPSGYGLYPGRNLVIVVAIWALVIPVYTWSIWRAPLGPNPSSGIYRVWSSDRIEFSRNEPRIEGSAKVERMQRRGLAAVGAAAYFSLLSAFYIGWRELNVGAWIARIQPKEYEMRATGWVRVAAGVQSLLSVYLIALWVLTYFGRPFE